MKDFPAVYVNFPTNRYFCVFYLFYWCYGFISCLNIFRNKRVKWNSACVCIHIHSGHGREKKILSMWSLRLFTEHKDENRSNSIPSLSVEYTCTHTLLKWGKKRSETGCKGQAKNSSKRLGGEMDFLTKECFQVHRKILIYFSYFICKPNTSPSPKMKSSVLFL